MNDRNTIWSGNSVELQYTKNTYNKINSFDDQWNRLLIIRVDDWHIPFVVTMDIDTNTINKRKGDEIIKKFYWKPDENTRHRVSERINNKKRQCDTFLLFIVLPGSTRFFWSVFFVVVTSSIKCSEMIILTTLFWHSK